MAHQPEVSVTALTTLQWLNELTLEPKLIQSQVVTFLPNKDSPPSAQSQRNLLLSVKKDWIVAAYASNSSVSQVSAPCP